MNYEKDVFIECMVKRKFSYKDWLIWIGIVIGGSALVYLGFYLGQLTMLLAAPFFIIVGVIAGAYYLFTRRNVEFEYAVTNGDVSVDKIINKRSRKRLASFDCKDVMEYGEFDFSNGKLKNAGVEKSVVASVNENGAGSKYLITKTKKGQNILLLFDPDERTEEAMRPFMPQHIRAEMMKRLRDNIK